MRQRYRESSGQLYIPAAHKGYCIIFATRSVNNASVRRAQHSQSQRLRRSLAFVICPWRLRCVSLGTGTKSQSTKTHGCVCNKRSRPPSTRGCYRFSQTCTFKQWPMAVIDFLRPVLCTPTFERWPVYYRLSQTYTLHIHMQATASGYCRFPQTYDLPTRGRVQARSRGGR